MLENKMISIIILTFNRSLLLLQSVQSILKQTYTNFEIIIVNDGSTDDSSESLKAIADKRIRVFDLEKQNNIARLRNFGIQKSEGDLISFCDDDDLWEHNKLELQLKYLDRYNFVFTNAKLIDSKGLLLKDNYIKLNKTGIVNTEMLLIENFIMTPSVLFKKKILKTETPFDENNFYNLCEDYNLWLKLSKENDLFFLNLPLVSIRRHRSLSSNDQSAVKIIQNHIKLINPFTKSIKKSLKKTAYVALMNNRINLLNEYLSNKEFKLYTKEFLVLSINVLVNPFYFSAFVYKLRKFLFEKKQDKALNRFQEI